MDASRSELLRTLAQRIQEIEGSGFAAPCATYSLGIPVLDGLLPGRRLPAGSLVELLAATEGAGVWTLALFMARQLTGEQAGLVIVDSQGSFYPPAAVKLVGLELGRTIVVRPRTPAEAHAACQEALRCSAVGAVIGWHQQIRARQFRQLQLAAEAGRGVGFLLRPAGARSAPSFALLRLLVSPVASTDTPRRIQIEVVRCRGGKEGQSLLLEIDDETGHVHSPARLAAPAPLSRTAGASG